MGMPISNYTVLKALVDKDVSSSKYEKSIALTALSPFNLFAFIIHDPEEHYDFGRQISVAFDRLDFVTGKKLLFFTLVDPPSDWLAHASNRSYYQNLKSWGYDNQRTSGTTRETNQLLDPINAIFSGDESATAFSLANSLGIPTEKLPCIVVTPDFSDDHFLWYRTCPEHLEEQLTRLAYLAARDRTSFDEIQRENLDLCNGSGDKWLEGNLAKALSDVLSFVIAGNSSDSWARQHALGHAQETISELHRALSNLKRNSQETNAEEMDRLCLKMALFISHLNTQKNLILDDFISVSKEFLENDSYQILKTAHRVFNLLVSEQDDAKHSLKLKESLDFTPGIICLAKVFEKEANLSVVHWIRKELGVSLPSYFNKHQPHFQARLTPNFQGGREIDFNVQRSGGWLAPGIGQSEIACKELSQSRLPQGWDTSSWNLLLSNWQAIREKRNEAAHTKMVGESSLMIVKNSLMKLSSGHIFEKFYRMKSEYSGN